MDAKQLDNIEARLLATTPGPYLRNGRLIYALVDNPRPSKGMPDKVNSFMASVQPGSAAVSTEELDATAEMFRAAPTDLAALVAEVRAQGERIESAKEALRDLDTLFDFSQDPTGSAFVINSAENDYLRKAFLKASSCLAALDAGTNGEQA